MQNVIRSSINVKKIKTI